MALKYLPFIISLLLITPTYAQLQTPAVADWDVLIIYSDTSINSAVRYKLKRNDLLLLVEDDKCNTVWQRIEVPEHTYFSSNHQYSFSSVSGYVKVSEIIPIDQLGSYLRSAVYLDFIVVKNDRLSIRDTEYPIYGVESDIYEVYIVEQAHLNVNDIQIPLEEYLYEGLCNIVYKTGVVKSTEPEYFQTYLKDDCIYIKQRCSYGAGGLSNNLVYTRG